MILKTLIVEDEIESLELMINLLSEYENISIVGFATDGETACEKINTLKPDLIFLDIELPIFNAFEVLNKIDYKPKVIFCTAYSEYAVKAFEVEGIDYLLKPITKARLKDAVNRVTLNNVIDIDEKIEKIVQKILKKEKSRLPVKQGDDLFFISQEDIYYISRLDGYTLLYTYDEEYFIDKTLNELEEILDPNNFCRVHRSYIIALNKIQNLTKRMYWKYKAILNDKKKTKINISKTYEDMLKEKLLL